MRFTSHNDMREKAMFLFQKIEETMMKYSDARHAVGEFIIQQQGNVYKYTIGEIAERTYTSKATVVRFAKSMGYDGWKEFMKDYIEEVQYQKVHENEIDFNFPFQAQDDVNTILSRIQKLQISSINETADLLEPEMIDIAVERIVKAKNIVVFATSPNNYYGELFVRKLYSIGILARVAPNGESGLIAEALGPDDCAIIISYSGNNQAKEPINKVKILKDNHVPMIGITSGGNNYMREKIDCIFTMTSRERLYTKIANFSTEESLGFILNCIYSCVFAREYRANKNYKILNSRILEQERFTQIKELQDQTNE